MRRLLAVVILAVAVPAHADNFFDIAGGIAAPLSDKNWTNLVDTIPKLQLRAGALNGDLGALVSLDWTPESLNNSGGAFPGGSVDINGHRFRLLVQGVGAHHVTPKVMLVGRVGAGIDLAYESYSASILGSNSSHSDLNAGIAFALGGGALLDVSDSMQVGVDLALPIGYHNHKSSGNGDIAFDYTSLDLDLLFGLRFWSR